MSNKKNLPAEEINFSLGFFARLIWYRVERLHFAVLIRKFNVDGVSSDVRHLAITVDGMDKYAFDINEGMFVRLEEDITVMPAQLFRDGENKYVLRYGNEETLMYSRTDFLRTYKPRVVNSLLYK